MHLLVVMEAIVRPFWIRHCLSASRSRIFRHQKALESMQRVGNY